MLSMTEVKEIAEILKEATKSPIHPEAYFALDSLVMEIGLYFEEKSIPSFSFDAFCSAARSNQE